jgi:hypothetical protein
MQNVIKKSVTQKSGADSSTLHQITTQDTPPQTAASIIYFVSGLLEVTLMFRLFFKITGANPASGFVSGIYGFTQMLTAPFSGIFRPAVTTGIEVKAVFEPAVVVAMLTYAVLTWGLVQLVAIMAGQSGEEL